jgi:hypothetical protein
MNNGKRRVRPQQSKSSSGEPIRRSGTDWAAAIELQRAARNAVMRLSGEPDVK